ncbi:zinc finger ZZ-type and EF-hand domain-containing protein 1-like isoform X2 [Babylonia areolata]|uniref:zinc finger ZZ-type and EF-hand domain-containing protein 1-like isoform X2 n=1 Tax=Babylonia areolata TaxID=304850 RepID=UPI003FD67649
MGNSASSSDSEDEGRVEFKEMDDGFSDAEMEMGDKDGNVTTDLHSLFSDPASLRTVAAKIKERIPENVIHQHHSLIIRWLRDRVERLEESVTLAQFCSMLMAKGVSREEAIKAFQPFDTDGNGTAEVVTMLDMVTTYTGPNTMGELGKNIRMLQACSLLPGFVDVYAGDTNPIAQHGEKILKYLLRNRAETGTLPFPHLNGFNNTCSMRLSVLRNIFNTLKDAARIEGEDQVLAEGEELKPISKCYSSIEVSTNSSEAYRLTNGDAKTFWQSDGAARSHWIRLHIRNNVVIKQLSISVASCDQSYMPELISVTGGRTPRNLRELKEVHVPGHLTGEVVLLKNAKVHYPILQINIRRCHSDGCDTRVHGIRTLGYKVVKESGLSVVDASAKWYLQVLAATVTATVPQSPGLRTVVLENTKKALENMPPLSLGVSSGERPQFLSRHVLEEMENFLTSLTSEEGKLMAEGLTLLLSLNLARGHVAALVRTIRHLFENSDLSLPCMPLMQKMMDTRNTCWEKMGSPLQMTLVGCDGGKNDDSSVPANVLFYGSGSGQNNTYVTEEGKTKVNMFFKSSDMIQITKVRIKVASGGRGPRRGLVFVFNLDKPEFKLDDYVEKFSIYDKWAEFEYKFSVQVRSAGVAGKPDNPVAYFTFDDDCDEIDVPVSWYPSAQYILVKFLEPRQETFMKLGIVGIKFFGFVKQQVFPEDDSKRAVMSTPSKQTTCSSADIVQRVLTFLTDLSMDQGKKKAKLTRQDFLDYSGLELEVLCKLYISFYDSPEEKWKTCGLHLMELLHRLIPYLSLQNASCKETAEMLFQHLCRQIDDPSIDHKSKAYKLAEQLIVDGASLFFPCKDSKRQRLFSMMNNVDKLSTAPSVSLVFQSLCQFFSTVDPHGLLDLPKVPTETFDPGRVLEVMRTLVVVAGQELAVAVSRDEDRLEITHLIRLISALQTSLLVWCWQQLLDPDTPERLRATACHMLVTYSSHVSVKAVEACQLLKKKEKSKLEEYVKNLSPAFLSSIVRQLVLILMFMVDSMDSNSRVAVLQSFYTLFQELTSMEETAPSLFPEMTSDSWFDMKNEDIVLRTWDVESPHNYDNNSSITQVFSSPGATKFIIDFDPRCETERRYDYLEFTDAKGVKVRYDQKVGTNKWPKQVHFAGPHLHFIFRSDSSNTEWGYKFKVTAKGSPDVPLSWAYDLQLGLTRLFGCLCGATLAANPVMPGDSLHLLDDSAEQDVLRSELWTTLFRGGYMMGKLQRSLSGKFETDECTAALLLLNELISQPDNDGDDDIKAMAQKLKEKCLEHKPKTAVGGEDVDAAVWAVFAALVWHTQQLRQDMDKFTKNPETGVVTEGLLQAYTTAESLRMGLASQRQKLAAHEELTPENNPVLACKEKAIYLLRFSGLTKVQLKSELRAKTNKLSLKKSGNRRFEKQGVRMDIAEKFPSFRLVMEFVQDPAWSTDRVHQMLQERIKFATSLCEVYTFCAEFIRVVSKEDMFQIPVVLFLQSMLSYQEKFAKHYADGLDGCGLGLESRVRLAYYLLIRRLLEPFDARRPHNVDPKVLPAYDFIQACLLHLLDTQWQPNDLAFVKDIKLPDLFFTLAKDTVKMRDITVGSGEREEELKEYDQCMKWFEECSKGMYGFNSWYTQKEDAAKEERQAIQMFVARFCDLLDVEISCDGCGVTLPGRRYRCYQCVDMDLCTTCYSGFTGDDGDFFSVNGGVKPEGEHHDDHDFVHLLYKCNKCQAFIVGTRIHCNDCEDFDLCLGCHTRAKFPSGHLASHDVTEIPMVKLRNSQTNDSLIKAYIHQHIWLLFTSLSLGLSDIVYNTNNCAQYMDAGYVRLAAELHHRCITIVAHCLETVPQDADDVIVDGTPNLRMSTLPIETRQDEAFATHSQERIMGLLGAMIPPRDKESGLESSFVFTDETFINLLFKVSKGDSGHDSNCQHLAMGLLARVLSTSDTKMVGGDGEKETVKGTLAAGQETISHFFKAGADAIDSNVEWSSSVARLLGTLCKSSVWCPAVHSHITASIDSLRKKANRSSLFSLFVMAGFPEVLSVGTLVQYCHTSLETKKGVVIKHFTDKHQCLVVDLHSRKRYTVKDQDVSCQNEVMELWDDSHMAEFTALIMDTVAKIRAMVAKVPVHQKNEEVSVEGLWVLAMVLKVLHNLLRSNNLCSSPDVFRAEFIQCLVFIASKGTGFSQQWLLKDLEVLSLNLYTPEDQPPAAKKAKIITKKEVEPKVAEKDIKESDTGEDDNDDDDDDDDEDMFDEDNVSSATSWEDEEETKDIFDKADPKTKAMFEALHHDLKIPMSVLHVLYDMHEGQLDAIMKALVENFENSPEITNFMEKWSSDDIPVTGKTGEKETVTQEKVIDTGIYYHPDIGRLVSNPNVANEETGEVHQDLFQPSERLAGEITEQRRNKSADLLKKELQKQGRFASREMLAKVNLAIAVLYARHVLTGLLAQWPSDGPVINAALLGCKELHQIPCVLDLLFKADNRDCFKKVVEKVIEHCDLGSLVPIAFTASQFMEEVTLSSVVKESGHNYTSGHSMEKIQLPGASFLTISFDSRCSTAVDSDILQFSTSEDFSKDMHAFSGAKPRWNNFQVPGDTIYYKFIMEGDSFSVSYWGYKFTVVAGISDSFETGHTILESILASPMALSLKLGEIWRSLAYVACKQTSTQRLMAIQLLLSIIMTQLRNPPTTKAKSSSSSEAATASRHPLSLPPPLDPTPPPRPVIDLSLLRPLWNLYVKVTGKEEESSGMQQPMVRALTELFLQVENLALAWDMVDDYLAAMANVQDVKNSLLEGLSNVAIVSASIGETNAATELAEKAGFKTSILRPPEKPKTPPPPPADTAQPTPPANTAQPTPPANTAQPAPPESTVVHPDHSTEII